MGLGRVRRRSYKLQEVEEMRKSFLEEEEEEEEEEEDGSMLVLSLTLC